MTGLLVFFVRSLLCSVPGLQEGTCGGAGTGYDTENGLLVGWNVLNLRWVVGDGCVRLLLLLWCLFFCALRVAAGISFSNDERD